MRSWAGFTVIGFTLASVALGVGCTAASEDDPLAVSAASGAGSRTDAGVTGDGLAPSPVAADPPAPAPNQPGGCVVVRVASQSGSSGAEDGFAAAAAPAGKRVIFVNRNGGTYYPGNGYDNSSANQSSLVSQVVTMPAYTRTDADWAQLMMLTRQTYAPYNVTVTDVDPGAAPHVEVVVSGNPSMIGQPSTAAGISPLTPDCSVIERAVVFAFDQLLQGPDDQARVVTHEAGHAFGLDHAFYCPDLMSYLFDCAWPKHFIDATVACGEYQARACNCGGEQDTVQHLFSVLGQNDGTTSGGGGADADAGTATPSALQITLSSPDDGATLPGNSAVSLTAGITGGTPSQVLLEWEMPTGTVEVDCDALPANTTCQRAGGNVTFGFTAGTGARAWSIRAVDGGGATVTSDRRSLTLSAPSASLPIVNITSPSAGDTYNPGDTVQLRIGATAAAGVSQVWLTWNAPSGSTQTPLTYLGDAQWGLDVPISTTAVSGARSLRITAYDPANAAGSTDVTINVQ